MQSLLSPQGGAQSQTRNRRHAPISEVDFSGSSLLDGVFRKMYGKSPEFREELHSSPRAGQEYGINIPSAYLTPGGPGPSNPQPVLPDQGGKFDESVPATPPGAGMSAQPASAQGFQYQDQTQYGYTPVDPQNPAAVTQQVQDDQLMRNQLDSLLGWDSPYMRRARQQGINRASARGLGNSSIAAGNAMGAAIDRALPIAQFDAARFGDVANRNQSAQNTMANANAGRSLQADMFNQQQQLAWDQFAHGQQMDWWNANRADRTLNSRNYQSMFGNYWNAVNAIYANPNLSAEQQTAAVANLRDMFPGFANDAWGAIPPGLMAPGAVPAAQMMPPMPPMFDG